MLHINWEQGASEENTQFLRDKANEFLATVPDLLMNTIKEHLLTSSDDGDKPDDSESEAHKPATLFNLNLSPVQLLKISPISNVRINELHLGKNAPMIQLKSVSEVDEEIINRFFNVSNDLKLTSVPISIPVPKDIAKKIVKFSKSLGSAPNPSPSSIKTDVHASVYGGIFPYTPNSHANKSQIPHRSPKDHNPSTSKASSALLSSLKNKKPSRRQEMSGKGEVGEDIARIAFDESKDGIFTPPPSRKHDNYAPYTHSYASSQQSYGNNPYSYKDGVRTGGDVFDSTSYNTPLSQRGAHHIAGGAYPLNQHTMGYGYNRYPPSGNGIYASPSVMSMATTDAFNTHGIDTLITLEIAYNGDICVKTQATLQVASPFSSNKKKSSSKSAISPESAQLSSTLEGNLDSPTFIKQNRSKNKKLASILRDRGLNDVVESINHAVGQPSHTSDVAPAVSLPLGVDVNHIAIAAQVHILICASQEKKSLAKSLLTQSKAAHEKNNPKDKSTSHENEDNDENPEIFKKSPKNELLKKMIPDVYICVTSVGNDPFSTMRGANDQSCLSVLLQRSLLDSVYTSSVELSSISRNSDAINAGIVSQSSHKILSSLNISFKLGLFNTFLKPLEGFVVKKVMSEIDKAVHGRVIQLDMSLVADKKKEDGVGSVGSGDGSDDDDEDDRKNKKYLNKYNSFNRKFNTPNTRSNNQFNTTLFTPNVFTGHKHHEHQHNTYTSHGASSSIDKLQNQRSSIDNRGYLGENSNSSGKSDDNRGLVRNYSPISSDPHSITGTSSSIGNDPVVTTGNSSGNSDLNSSFSNISESPSHTQSINSRVNVMSLVSDQFKNSPSKKKSSTSRTLTPNVSTTTSTSTSTTPTPNSSSLSLANTPVLSSNTNTNSINPISTSTTKTALLSTDSNTIINNTKNVTNITSVKSDEVNINNSTNNEDSKDKQDTVENTCLDNNVNSDKERNASGLASVDQDVVFTIDSAVALTDNGNEELYEEGDPPTQSSPSHKTDSHSNTLTLNTTDSHTNNNTNSNTNNETNNTINLPKPISPVFSSPHSHSHSRSHSTIPTPLSPLSPFLSPSQKPHQSSSSSTFHSNTTFNADVSPIFSPATSTHSHSNVKINTNTNMNTPIMGDNLNDDHKSNTNTNTNSQTTLDSTQPDVSQLDSTIVIDADNIPDKEVLSKMQQVVKKSKIYNMNVSLGEPDILDMTDNTVLKMMSQVKPSSTKGKNIKTTGTSRLDSETMLSPPSTPVSRPLPSPTKLSSELASTKLNTMQKNIINSVNSHNNSNSGTSDSEYFYHPQPIASTLSSPFISNTNTNSDTLSQGNYIPFNRQGSNTTIHTLNNIPLPQLHSHTPHSHHSHSHLHSLSHSMNRSNNTNTGNSQNPNANHFYNNIPLMSPGNITISSNLLRKAYRSSVGVTSPPVKSGSHTPFTPKMINNIVMLPGGPNTTTKANDHVGHNIPNGIYDSLSVTGDYATGNTTDIDTVRKSRVGDTNTNSDRFRNLMQSPGSNNTNDLSDLPELEDVQPSSSVTISNTKTFKVPITSPIISTASTNNDLFRFNAGPMSVGPQTPPQTPATPMLPAPTPKLEIPVRHSQLPNPLFNRKNMSNSANLPVNGGNGSIGGYAESHTTLPPHGYTGTYNHMYNQSGYNHHHGQDTMSIEDYSVVTSDPYYSGPVHSGPAVSHNPYSTTPYANPALSSYGGVGIGVGVGGGDSKKYAHTSFNAYGPFSSHVPFGGR